MGWLVPNCLATNLHTQLRVLREHEKANNKKMTKFKCMAARTCSGLESRFAVREIERLIIITM